MAVIPIRGHYVGDNRSFKEYSFNTADFSMLPTEGIVGGSIAVEVETGDFYLFDQEQEEWNNVSQ